VHLSVGEGRYRIELECLQIGNDRLFIITSAKEGHIGAVTLAEKKGLQTLSKQGHRDDIVSQSVAEILHRALGEDIVVVCGIHIDHATKEEIETLVVNAQQCATHYLKELNDE
jgi:hypothetical protein